MSRVLLLNGPNLNLLGTREPGHYGSETLNSIIGRLKLQAERANLELLDFQTNHEGLLIDRIHQSLDEDIDYIIINPAAFTHQSIAVRDALLATKIPFIEVHLSNVHQREPFRHHSYFSDVASGIIVGLGPIGYELALQAIIRQLKP